MKYVLRLNMISLLYAFMIFMPIELMLNMYQFTRLTHVSVSTMNILFGFIVILFLIGGSFGFTYLTKNWLGRRKTNLISVILWFPYFALFIYLFNMLFPMTDAGDIPNPATGLILIGGLFVYSIYILIINMIGLTLNARTIH